MRILVNGEAREIAAATLEGALAELGYGASRIATAVDGDFVPASRRADRSLADGAAVEIVAPMQGVRAVHLYGVELGSRLFLGTAQYPSPAVLADAVRASGTELVTVSLRRESAGMRSGQAFWSLIQELGVRVLPNTAGCHSVREAVTTAEMAREVFGTDWVKLEVIGEGDTLQPDVFGLVEAARILTADGFKVFPYTTEDLVVAERLLRAGCEVLMPWGAPIGSRPGG